MPKPKKKRKKKKIAVFFLLLLLAKCNSALYTHKAALVCRTKKAEAGNHSSFKNVPLVHGWSKNIT